MTSKHGPEIERRFLLERRPEVEKYSSRSAQIEQIYLELPDQPQYRTHRVRRMEFAAGIPPSQIGKDEGMAGRQFTAGIPPSHRGKDEGMAGRQFTAGIPPAPADVRYYYTVKSPLPDGSRQEDEREITYSEFQELLKYRAPDRRPVLKVRHDVQHEGHTLEIDLFEKEYAGLVILEVELTSFEVPLQLPDWVGRFAEITHEPRFSNYHLSLVKPEEIFARAREALQG